jgi:AraC-like DNA-binding protein
MIESDAPLTAIAIDSGFASLAHFSAAFRRATGQSPTQWRSGARK